MTVLAGWEEGEGGGDDGGGDGRERSEGWCHMVMVVEVVADATELTLYILAELGGELLYGRLGLGRGGRLHCRWLQSEVRTGRSLLWLGPKRHVAFHLTTVPCPCTAFAASSAPVVQFICTFNQRQNSDLHAIYSPA